MSLGTVRGGHAVDAAASDDTVSDDAAPGTTAAGDTAGPATPTAPTSPTGAAGPRRRSAPAAPPVWIGGWGGALPATRVTNADLEAHLDTSDEWIATRTGIRERRRAAAGETTAPLATLAARRALAVAGIDAAEVDLIIVATCTPEVLMPSTAALVADELGASAGGYDLNAACAGFVYALTTATASMQAGLARTALVVGSDTMSSIVDDGDRNTAVLFGDGAAAVVLTGAASGAVTADADIANADTANADAAEARTSNGTAGATTAGAAGSGVPGLVASDLLIDTAGVDLLSIPAGGSRRPATAATVAAGEHTLRMEGRELFRQAVRGVTASVQRTLERAGCEPDDVALFVPHQANSRIVDAVLARTGLPAERTWSNIARLGNTSAASVPLALCEAADQGRLHDGDLVLLTGFGAGLSIGTALWRWSTTPTTTPGASDG